MAGVILHGSLVLGDFVPGRSDIDLLVVVENRLPDARLAALVEALPDEAPSRVDLRLATREVASAPTPLPPMELYVVLPAVEVEMHHPGERDLLVELSVCRAHGRSLAGAEPRELIGEVPDRWVQDVGDAQLADWQALEYEPRYAELMVFTACRVWHFGEEGRHCSKAAAGEWALAREPGLQAVRAALRRRHADSTVAIDEEQVRELLALARR